ncbi:MAG: 30S ribosomal protein S8 [Deltaproteobacteria bacterium RIFCSPLOWO2_01_44_7]|nr:MAG: 30S ribosomal protein S8 [Deltaproteobacteria bacterium RIFCSPHIGHO2_01_FULL_43_49]OGQ14959.1 MAG: 30S ribosomal protein S8 [Deltaproteobacteria bacterium RIFCSPHIGHO2_02_FULL_44_53]OGQ29538.1 MAG: 30S ribosomal protein S8 [Deltaproteobacteria bacterium RIFCSPHIGHO2_12_FULL_44_21]OGQ31071.1 MAG: 30S ribosomal protein S8 [Deltaproteobacteria bacterium RIFCSPLOWO2_01_FULL_45_74]OGQ38656.1 MAG: 30S ribosomal protein S8 [Deltaproteobacteria bacterium RIFCSPLOWO2_01_44_7]OGQ42673.1 MAG: 30S
MLTDSLADMLTRMRNAIMMRHAEVSVPHSRLKESILKVFHKEGLIVGFETVGEKVKKAIVVQLKYGLDGTSAITTLRKISKPSRRVFNGYQNLKAFRQGLGMTILSTPKGIMTDGEARKQKVGGEVLIEIW